MSALPVSRDAPFRRLPVGAELVAGGGVDFRVWAPACRTVEVAYEAPGGSRLVSLDRDAGGYFAGTVREVGAGTRYRFRLDGDALYPDPASRFQPGGPHECSQVVDPAAFRWSDAAWRGVRLEDAVVYEMHVGTFTREGTWAAATRELPELAALGITVVEMMPVADFCGRFGWGYDGVDQFAPTRLYGTPDDLRAFVDRAHACGIAVLLDVVYNHFGPDGAYFKPFSPDWFSTRYENEWGEPLNFDAPGSAAVREFFVANARYWVEEFHFDGLRLDATQQIFDASPVHVTAEITRAVREAAAGRATLVIAENEPQDTDLVRAPARGGLGMDALWNDDFHHSARVALTSRNEAYYSDYLGNAQELLSAVKWGYLYQGQRYKWQGKRRGSPAFDVPPAGFVNYIQNHDQVANSGDGRRVHVLASPGKLRAITALMLLAPGTPMLFQGQEFAASAPFLFFADHKPELAAAVRKGRAQFMSQFPSVATPEAQSRLPHPDLAATFERCKLDFSERERHAGVYLMHRELLRLRREDATLRRAQQRHFDGAALTPDAFVLRYFGVDGDDRLLLVNLGRDLRFWPAPEPLLAPLPGSGWRVLWSSEDPRYGGIGTPAPETEEGWRIPGQSALLLAPEPGDPLGAQS